MYEEFYGFRDNPFRLTPDPEYLFLSTNHQEALAHLLVGVSEGSGVVVITGEIGTGKTTLLRTLIRNLDVQTTVAYIFNPALSALELLQTINADLGLLAASTSKKELIDELNRFLLAQRTAGRRVVVIIDEAQNLEPPVLEQLRLLSNLETEREKLLQIILVGQPELGAMLARPELTQLNQRVTLRWHLVPLKADETAAYVRHRIRLTAGGREPVHFTSHALRAIHRFSHGVPRVINALCHRTLLISYTREERRIGWAIVRQATKELRHQRRRSHSAFFRPMFASGRLMIGGLVLLVVGLFAGALLRNWFPWLTPSAPHEAPAQASTTLSPTPSTLGPASDKPQPSAAHVTSAHSAPSSSPLLGAAESAATAASNGTAFPAATSTVHAGETMAADAFLQELQSLTLEDSAIRATDGLLRAWGVKKLQSTEWQNSALDLDAVARARGLEHMPLGGAFSLLTVFDLPVILELPVPARQEVRFLLLLGITDDRCRVLLDREREVPLRVLREYWSGRSHLFWKDFDSLGDRLSVGSIGENVRQLHALLFSVQALGDAELPSAGRETIFSRKTEKAVARFQRAKRLTPDGVVGPLTMILLYNALPAYTHPSLNMIARTPVPEEVSAKKEGTEKSPVGMQVNSEEEGT